MRFLLDMPVSPRLTAWLEERGHDAVHASTRGLERASDSELVAAAVSEQRIIVTADTDFPRLLALAGASMPGVILFRGGNYSFSEMTRLLAMALESLPEIVLQRSICTVDRRGIRHRFLPLR
jgi:predicted nuclease of predicted toxin-antitoxin system